MNRIGLSLMLTCTALLLACSSVKHDWSKATATNTVASYQEYLSKHPSGEHSSEASDRIRALQDEQAWQHAKQANSSQAYQDYLQKQPAGTHGKEAREALAAQQRAADWQTADQTGTVAALQGFLKKYPQGSEADQARAKLAMMSYRVELGSVRTQRQAQRERDRLRENYADVLHDAVVVPAQSGKGYQVQSGLMSETQAYSGCAELKKAHQRCEVVKSEAAAS